MAAYYRDENDPVKIIMIGMAAPAMLVAIINANSHRSADHFFHDYNLVESASAQPNDTPKASQAQKSPVQRFLEGLFGNSRDAFSGQKAADVDNKINEIYSQDRADIHKQMETVQDFITQLRDRENKINELYSNLRTSSGLTDRKFDNFITSERSSIESKLAAAYQYEDHLVHLGTELDMKVDEARRAIRFYMELGYYDKVKVEVGELLALDDKISSSSAELTKLMSEP